MSQVALQLREVSEGVREAEVLVSVTRAEFERLALGEGVSLVQVPNPVEAGTRRSAQWTDNPPSTKIACPVM